jgi:hypothetical protein
MKNLLFLLLITFTAIITKAQTILFSDNFDSYTSGQLLVQQNHVDWDTWSHSAGGAEDAPISNTYSSSSPNSLHINTSSDIIYKFLNQTTGHFEIAFDIFIPSSSSGAYFNMQHYFNPGIEWAFECYFSNDSTGYILVGGTTYNFTYPENNWFGIEGNINLNSDSIYLKIDNTIIASWPFHYVDNNTDGVCQLGSINFYSASPTGSGDYYIDNFVFTEIVPAELPEIEVLSDSVINETVNYQTGGTHQFTINNNGGTPLQYRIIPSYTIPNPDSTSIGSDTLYYCGNNYTSIVFGDATEIAVAAGFPSENIQDHIGRTINQIDVTLFSVIGIAEAKIIVATMGNMEVPGPGEIIYEQIFTPVNGKNQVQLTNPVLIDGSDFWVGFIYTVAPGYEGVSSIGCDNSVSGYYGNWYKTDAAWNRLSSNNPTLPYAWNIWVHIDGTPINPWMNISPNSGSINSNSSKNITINLGADDIQLNDQKSGKIHIHSNDFFNSSIVLDINVNFTVSINENKEIEISIYPNPTSDNINISSQQINKVEIYNISSQKVFEQTYNSNFITISTDNLKSGVYFVKIITESGSGTKKVIIK